MRGDWKVVLDAKMAGLELTYDWVKVLPSSCPKCGMTKAGRGGAKLWRTVVVGKVLTGIYECRECAHLLCVEGMIAAALGQKVEHSEPSQLAGRRALDVDVSTEVDGDEAGPVEGGDA